MKRITRLSSAILVFFLLFSFISCTNILASDSDSESNNQNQTNGKVTLKGTINVSALEGAMPSACINSSTSSSENGEERSASFSTLPTGYQYFAKATKRGTTTVVGTAADECVWMGSDSDKSFAMNLDYGTWDVVAGLCVAGSAPNPAPEQIIYISPEREINLPVGAPLIYTASFSARPRMTDDGEGTIRLTMTNSSNLKFATCRLLIGDTSAWTAAGFGTGDSLSKLSISDNVISLGNGASIKSGAYTVQIKFYDCLDYDASNTAKDAAATLANGKEILVYSTIQTINVFDNLETNYWTRTVNDSYSPVAATGGTFELRDEIVSHFSRTHIYVSSAANGGSDSNSGTAYQPFATLNRAISYIDSQGNTTTKQPFTITVNGNVSSSAVISTTTAAHASSITIEGKTGSSSDVLNGGGTNRVLEISSTVPVTLSKIKVTAGKASTGGGGIRVAGSDSSNKAKLYIQSGTLITGNQLSSNANGIGLYAEYADVEMNGGEISGNSNNTNTEIHGAVGLSHAKFTLNDGEITGNSVKHLGANLHVNNSSELYIKGGKITNGTITRTGGDANAAGIWVDGNSSVEMTAGEISGNRVTVTGDEKKASGAAIYIGGNCSFKMSGGKIENNAVSAPIVRGGAIYFGNGATFELSGSAVIPYGAKNESNVIEKAAGKNDIFLYKNSSDDTKTTIKITSSTLSGIDSDGKVAAITMSDCKRGSRFLSADNETYLNNNKNKFILTHNTTDDKGWERWNNTSDTIKYVTINSPVYVASIDSGTTDSSRKWCPDTASLNDAERNGLCTKPFKSLNDAIAYISDSTKDAYAGSGKPAEIIIDGTITGTQQEIADTFTSAMAASLTIKGYKAPSATSSAATIKRYSSAPGSAQSTGTALKINTTVPVTIEDLTITGGKSNVAGGGIYLKQSGTLKLGNGVKITGNSTTNKGGGVYVDVGAKLFMYGTSLIGDSTTSTVLATDAAGGGGSANTAIMGGGIHNEKGEVYIGYDGLTGSPATPHKCDMLNGYGIRRNYVSGEAYSVGAGLSSIQGNVYISSGTISYNQSTISGGGIYSDGDSSNPAKIIIEAPVSSDNEFTMYGNKSVVGGAIHNSSNTTLTMSAGKIGGNPSNQQNTATNLGGAIYQGAKFTVSGSALIYPGSATSSLKTNDVYLPAGNFYVTAGSIGTSGNTSSLKMSLSPQEYKRGKKLVQADGVTVDATLWNKFQLTDNDGDWTKLKKTENAGESTEKNYVAITADVFVAGASSTTVSGVTYGKGLTTAEGALGTKSKPFKLISDALGVFEDSTTPAVVTVVGTTYPVAQEIPDTFTTSKASALTLKGLSSSSIGTIKRYTTAPTTADSTGSALTVNSAVPVTIENITITGGNAINGGGINITKGTVILSDGTKITGNIADTNGGGVYVAGSDGKLLMRGKSLIGDDANPSSPSAATSSAGEYANKAASGAGIYNNGGAVYLGYTLGSNGSPTTAGGTLVNNSSYGYFGVRHNYATTSGGGIYLADGTLEMGSGCVAYNQAASSAGGIYFANGATLEGGKIEGNQSKNGGGIYIDASKEVILKSVSLSSNKVYATNQDVYGGAVYNNGTLKIQNAIDVNANSGLATGHTAYGGAFYNKAGAEINITGGVRVNNNSATFGGAFYNSGTLILSNGTVGTGTMNTATSSGGAVYQDGTFKVSASAKIYNASQAATKNDVYLSGTTKYVTLEASLNTSGNTQPYPMLITPSRWYRGDKVLDGYSYISANYTKFKISDTEWELVSHGTSTSTAGRIDADIWVAGSGTLTSCSKAGNDSTGNGTKAKPYASIATAVSQCWGGPKDTATGGRIIYVEGTVTAATNTEQTISSSITSAKATAIKLSGNGSGVKLQAASGKRVLSIYTAVPVTITNMTISGGSTTSNGAGIYVSAAKASLTLTTSAVVTGNSTTAASGKGGGIYIAGTSGTGNAANLIMNGTSSISANSATGTSGVGGGVYLSYANLCMSGDALIGDTSGSAAATNGSTDHSNMAKNGGGVYCDTGSNVYLGFASASDSGTSLYKGIRHNYASSCGGGIYVNGGSVTLKTGYVSYNGTAATSDCDGGGIWQKSGTTVTISGGTIAKNKGYYGGGVYAGGTFTLSGGTIGDSSDKSAAANTTSSTNYSNYAAYGGGIYAPTGASVSVTSGYVSYNYATGDGGGIMAIPSFTFSANANYNQAAGSGGGIRCGSLSAQGGITISSGVIKGNKGSIGGGVYVKGVMTMSGGSINSNTATTTDSSDDGYNGGGGVFVEDYRFVMSGGTISGNESKSHGGGVFLQDANLYMSSGAVIGSSASSYPSSASSASNKAAGKGGGIYSNVDSIIYLGYTYSSTSSGDPLYNATTASFTGGLCNNFSSGDGGGIYCNGSGGVKMRLGYIKCNNANSKNGGGINFARGSNILLTGGEISSNYAKNGGGIYVGNTNPTINGTTMSSNQVTNAGCGGAVYVANGQYAGLTFAGSGKIVAGTGPTINTVYLETGAKISVTGNNVPTASTVATIIPASYSSSTQVMGSDSASLCAAKFKVWPTSSDNWLVQSGGYIDKGSRVTSASDAAAAIQALSSGKSARIIIECSVSNASTFFSTIKAALLNSSACISLDLTGVTGLTEISNNAFYGGSDGLTSLYSIRLPSTITRIGTNAFANCTNLGMYYNGSLTTSSTQTVFLPESCTEVGAAAFYNCYFNTMDLAHVNTLYTSACVGWSGTGNKTVTLAWESGQTARKYTGSSYNNLESGTYSLPLATTYYDYLGYGDAKLVRQ